MTRSTRPRALAASGAALLTLLAAGCGDDSASEDRTAGTSSATSTSPSTGSTSSSTTSGSSTTSATTTVTSSTPSSTKPTASACVIATADAMSPTQQAGQLLMVALMPQSGSSGLDPHIRDHGLGAMLYLGGWQDAGTVTATSSHLQSVAPEVGGTKVGMLVATDQEGGQVQQLTGPGFSTLPSGVDQGAMSSAQLRTAAKGWGRELAKAGVNVNLAPVADTVPPEVGRANDPIGRWGRQYGSTPKAAGRGALAFAQGMKDAGVEPTVKHFPGLGRITGNTDLTAEGIADTTATTQDPYLAPFQQNIDGGTRIVMVGSARYPKLDATNPALFSRPIVTDLLRERMGFDGVVITDDVGAAKAVAAWPVGERATRFVAAGGDIVLTADPGQVATMVEAITSRAKGDPAFAAKMDASVTRVLTLKEEMGLLRCG